MASAEPQTPSRSGDRFGAAAIFALAAAVALSFALFTDQRWEDYYITFRVSKNLALGLGPVFQAGERIHAFTSPLGMLLPAVISWMTGGNADEATLWIFRALTIGAFAGAVATVWSLARAAGWSRGSAAVAAVLLMTDAKSVSFSINGMETAFMLLFLALAIRQSVIAPATGGWKLGCFWGALMWTRPDSFVFFGSVALGGWLFTSDARVPGGRWTVAREYFKAGGVCAAIYLPWFLWAWSYFGSPVPHTIVAKGLDHHFPGWGALLFDLVTLPIRVWGRGGWDSILTPIYFFPYGGWPPFIAYFARALIVIAGCAFALPRMSPLVRGLSLALLIGITYLQYVDLFPWYFPPVAMLIFLAFAGVLEGLCRATGQAVFPLAAGSVAVIFTVSLLATSAWQLRQQQRIIEGQRREIGEWLRAHRDSPTDTVFLEPLGYIGYYSQLKMYDYPGLSSAEMIAARRQVGENRLALVAALTPRWIVQRPGELQAPNAEINAWFLGHYSPVMIFNVSDRIDAVPFLPGRPYLRFDQGFLLWKRHD
jgi:hypothetical protein